MDKHLIATPLLLVISIVYKLIPPSRINYIYGYRSIQSMQSQTKWIYANQLSSVFLCMLSSILMLILLSCNLFSIEFYSIYYFTLNLN